MTNASAPKSSSITSLRKLVGTWATEMTHPAMPGVVVRGAAHIEWLEGERFLVHRATTDHADFPDSLSIIGSTSSDRVEDGARAVSSTSEDELRMHYFDSRGVFRVYDVAMDDNAWRISRMATGFSQRFTGTFTDDGNTINGMWQVNEDDARWNDDLRITYRRR